MTIELTRRLLRGGLMAPGDVEAALLELIRRGVSLIQALAEQDPALLTAAERELDRGVRLPTGKVVALPEVAARLPAGMCERFLAVPVRSDAKTGLIDVACADPLDQHVASEFSFHLELPVRVIRAPFADIAAAIDGLHAGGTFREGVNRLLRTKGSAANEPHFGELAPKMSVHSDSERPLTSSPSEPPIPLVRKSASAKEPSRRSTEPGVGAGAAHAVLPAADETGEPVLALNRGKPLAARVVVPGLSEDLSKLDDDLTPRLESIKRANSADQLISALVQACESVAPRALIFAVKTARYEGRAASAGIQDRAQLGRLSFATSSDSVLKIAQDAGHYLGALPTTELYAPLANLLDAKEGTEIYAVRVTIAERPALIVLLAGFMNAFDTTRRADKLAAAAGNALSLIMRSRKGRH